MTATDGGIILPVSAAPISTAGEWRALSILLTLDAAAPSGAAVRVVSAIACDRQTDVNVLSVMSRSSAGAPSAGWVADPDAARRRRLIQEVGAVCPAALRWPICLREG